MNTTMASIERWNLFEVILSGPSTGNPFTDVQFSATFCHDHRAVEAPGFYDGEGRFIVRFMPDVEGEWRYATHSSQPELDGAQGGFTCITATAGNHGPVQVSNTYHFAYADGTPYIPVGTTCYAWAHQGGAMEDQTLATLAQSPFNKLRMCVFPKHYTYNQNEPLLYPFEGLPLEKWDFTRFNPAFFHHFEKRIAQLCALGIEADIILFHPYDRWGFSGMSAEADDRYLRYITARLWAYRNVWWSLANEYDFMRTKVMADWDRFFRLVQENDPAQHLRSIHNGEVLYDHNKPWVTHCSVQSRELELVTRWREVYRKPIVVDECSYEGNLQWVWGNVPPQVMIQRFWEGFARGGYVGHGETFLHPDDILWWSKGGLLRGESPPRIAFLREIWEDGPAEGVNPQRLDWNHLARVGKDPTYSLEYFSVYQPAETVVDMPEGHTYQADIIDTWNMTVSPIPGTFTRGSIVPLPARPYLALRLRIVS